MTEPLKPEENTTAPEADLAEKIAETNASQAQPAIESVAKEVASEPAGWERATLEKLMFATLDEQRTARRWRNAVRLTWLAFLVACVLF